MSKPKITAASENLIPSFYECLKKVASERVYLEMIEPPPIEKVTEYQMGLIKKNGPTIYAVEGSRVVGWCDIFPSDNPRQKHRGYLGMGILSEFRGKGLGSELLRAALDKANMFGLEKVELHVYTNNPLAIKLYEKFGFEKEGLIQKYRKLDGIYFDALMMSKFL